MPFDIRLSPSGPVIAQGGPGFQLRLAGSDVALTTSPVTTVSSPLVGNGGITTPMLGLPDPAKLYSVKGHFFVDSINAAGAFGANIQLSYDNVTWFDVPAVPQQLSTGFVNGSRSGINLYMAPILGSALPTPMTALDLELWSRIVVNAGANGNYDIPAHPQGMYGLELSEYAV